MSADPVAATVELLASRAAIIALAGADVFGEELPDEAAFMGTMPKYAIAIQSAGGTGAGDGSYLPVGGQRLDVNTYATSMYLARRLARAVHAELKAVVRELVIYDDEDGDPTAVLMHGYQVSSGYVALREPESRWPRYLRSYVATYDEREVTP